MLNWCYKDFGIIRIPNLRGRESYGIECAHCGETLSISRVEVEADGYNCLECDAANPIPISVAAKYRDIRAREERRIRNKEEERQEKERRLAASKAERDERQKEIKEESQKKLQQEPEEQSHRRVKMRWMKCPRCSRDHFVSEDLTSWGGSIEDLRRSQSNEQSCTACGWGFEIDLDPVAEASAGGSVNDETVGTIPLIGGIIAYLILLSVVVVLILRWERPSAERPVYTPSAPVRPQRRHDDPGGAWYTCRSYIERRSTSPSTIIWPWITSVNIRNRGGGRYSVKGYFDSQNTFGAMVRLHFVAEEEYSDGGGWRVRSLNLQ